MSVISINNSARLVKVAGMRGMGLRVVAARNVWEQQPSFVIRKAVVHEELRVLTPALRLIERLPRLVVAGYV